MNLFRSNTYCQVCLDNETYNGGGNDMHMEISQAV